MADQRETDKKIINNAITTWSNILIAHGNKDGGWMQMNQLMGKILPDLLIMREALLRKYDSSPFGNFAKENFDVKLDSGKNTYIKIKS